MLVTVNDLVTYMDISFSLRQQDAAEIVLAGLQSELEAYLGRPVEQTEFTETYRISGNNNPMPMSSFFYQQNFESSFYSSEGNALQSASNFAIPPETLYLRQAPVVSVEEIKLTPYGGTERILNPDTEYVVRRYGVDIYLLLADDLVEITYTAGLDGQNIPFFKSLILRAATREMQNMHDDVVGVKDLNTRNVAPLETGFTDRELKAVKSYKRHRVA